MMQQQTAREPRKILRQGAHCNRRKSRCATWSCHGWLVERVAIHPPVSTSIVQRSYSMARLIRSLRVAVFTFLSRQAWRRRWQLACLDLGLLSRRADALLLWIEPRKQGRTMCRSALRPIARSVTPVQRPAREAERVEQLSNSVNLLKSSHTSRSQLFRRVRWCMLHLWRMHTYGLNQSRYLSSWQPSHLEQPTRHAISPASKIIGVQHGRPLD